MKKQLTAAPPGAASASQILTGSSVLNAAKLRLVQKGQAMRLAHLSQIDRAISEMKKGQQRAATSGQTSKPVLNEVVVSQGQGKPVLKYMWRQDWRLSGGGSAAQSDPTGLAAGGVAVVELEPGTKKITASPGGSAAQAGSKKAGDSTDSESGEGEGEGEGLVIMTISSTLTDTYGDIMSENSLDQMAEAAIGRTFFLNHEYDVPEDVFGAVVKTEKVARTLVDIWTGELTDCICLDAYIKPETTNPRAETTWRMMQNGIVTLGASVGIFILEAHKLDDGRRVLDSVYWSETSVVGIPANAQSYQQEIRGLRQEIKSFKNASGQPASFAQYSLALSNVTIEASDPRAIPTHFFTTVGSGAALAGNNDNQEIKKQNASVKKQLRSLTPMPNTTTNNNKSKPGAASVSRKASQPSKAKKPLASVAGSNKQASRKASKVKKQLSRLGLPLAVRDAFDAAMSETTAWETIWDANYALSDAISDLIEQTENGQIENPLAVLQEILAGFSETVSAAVSPALEVPGSSTANGDDTTGDTTEGEGEDDEQYAAALAEVTKAAKLFISAKKSLFIKLLQKDAEAPDGEDNSEAGDEDDTVAETPEQTVIRAAKEMHMACAQMMVNEAGMDSASTYAASDDNEDGEDEGDEEDDEDTDEEDDDKKSSTSKADDTDDEDGEDEGDEEDDDTDEADKKASRGQRQAKKGASRGQRQAKAASASVIAARKASRAAQVEIEELRLAVKKAKLEAKAAKAEATEWEGAALAAQEVIEEISRQPLPRAGARG